MKIEFNSASESPALTGKIDIKEKQEKKNKNKQKQKERAKTKTKRQVADDSKVVYKETFIMKGRVNEKEIRTRKFRVQSNPIFPCMSGCHETCYHCLVFWRI